MIYAEASYFDGYHFAHIAARDEHDRLRRKRRAAAISRNRPRYSGRPILRAV